MEQRISLITLGVTNLERARVFYERLGWRSQEVEETVFFQTGGRSSCGDATSWPPIAGSATVARRPTVATPMSGSPS
jgi:catechol 2,3-dioxygenase-like lactoylglutathione lyase family enzyme